MIQRMQLVSARGRLEKASASLDALNPGEVLKRGYACVIGPDGVISSAAGIQAEMHVDIRLHDGIAEAQIIELKEPEDLQ